MSSRTRRNNHQLFTPLAWILEYPETPDVHNLIFPASDIAAASLPPSREPPAVLAQVARELSWPSSNSASATGPSITRGNGGQPASLHVDIVSNSAGAEASVLAGNEGLSCIASPGPFDSDVGADFAAVHATGAFPPFPFPDISSLRYFDLFGDSTFTEGECLLSMMA